MRFSDFLLVSDPNDLDFIVGYTEEQNIRISVSDFFGNQIDGSGNPGYIPVFTGTNVIANSQIFQDGSNIVIGGVNAMGYRLAVGGSLYALGGTTIESSIPGSNTFKTIGEEGDSFIVPHDSSESIQTVRSIIHAPAVLTTESATLGQVNSAILALEGDIDILLDLKVDKTSVGAPNGVASLDATGKVPLSEIPDSIIGQVEYMGTWNALTNTPTLNPLVPEQKGHYYVVSEGGTFGGVEYHVGDWIISNGVIWEKVDNTDAVTSVFGRIGAILALEGDYQSFYPRLSQAYDNPSWINSLAFTKITDVPPFLLENQTITLSGDVTGSGKTSIFSTISNNAVTDSKLRDSVGTSVIGRASSSTGDPGDIQASTDGYVLQRSGGSLLFGLISSDSIGSIDWSKIINTPTTLSGYGITDAYTKTESDNKFVPYTGANANVNLGSNNITANSLIKAGGTSAQFLKADGSVDTSQYVPTTRSVNAGTGLTGGGNLSSDITLAFDTTWGDNRYAYRTRQLTINGTTYDLSADRTWNVGTVDTLTTIGTSGPATLIGSVLNIPNYSTDLSGYVPYVGATQNLNLGTYGLLGDFVQFNLAPTSLPTDQGTMYWDADKETIDVILNGTTGSIFQDTFFFVKNQTGATIPKGTVVRANGTLGASGRILIAPFLADGTFDSKFCLGVTTEEILDGADGRVTYFGAIRKIDTSAYPNGTVLYASPTIAGGFTDVEPTGPTNNIISVAIVIYSDNNNGEVFVRPTFIDSANDIAKSLGYTPANAATTITINGVTYDLSANRSWSVGTVDTLTTTGTSGPATLVGSTLNIPNYTTDLSGYVTLDTTQTITGFKTILRGGDVLNFKIGTDTLYGLKVAYNQNELAPSGEATWSFVSTFNNGSGTGLETTPISFFRGVLVTGERLLSASVNSNLLDYYGNNPSGRYPIYAYNTGVQQFASSIIVGETTGVVNAVTGAIADLPAGVVANFKGRVIGSNAVNNDEFATLGQVTSTSRAAISLTTTGTSGPATYDNITGVLNIPEYQGGVTSFNGRTGAVTLTSGDVTTALGYTPVTDSRTLTINGETYDLTANRTWTVGVNPSAREIQTYIATAGQTVFTVTGGYTVGLVDVYINGVRLTSSDYTATNGTTVVLAIGTSVGNIVDIIKYTSGIVNSISGTGTTNELAYFTASTTIASLSTANYPSLTELSYVKGVTSSIQTQLNGKQNALTNPVTGTGTTNYLPKFTGSTTIGNSNIQDSGSLVTINSETKFQVGANATRNVYFGTAATNYGRITYNDATGELAIGTIENYSTLFVTNNTTKMTLTSSGNLGLGVTPSAWRSVDRAFQIGLGSFWSDTQLSANFSQNHYFSSTGRKYIANGRATEYEQYDGYHAWKTAPSGTAGNAISFTQAMTLFSTGNLLIGTTTDNGARLQVSGTSILNGSSKVGNASLASISTNSTGLDVIVGSGTNSSPAFQVWDDNSLSIPRLIVTRGGNVGIGTTSPADILHIRKSSSSNIDMYLDNPDTTNGNQARFIFRTTDSTGNTALNAGGIKAVWDNRSTNYVTSDVIIDTRGTDNVLVVKNDGNVIINGTTKGTSLNTALTVNNPSAGNYSGLIPMTADIQRGYYGGTSTGLEIGVAGSGLLDIYTNGSPRMRINSNGNVGIGTTTDNGAKLQVNGIVNFSSGVELSGTITNFGTGTGVYTRSTWYNDTSNQILFENARQTDSSSGTGRTVYFTWRGGPSVGGGVQLQHGTNAWAAYTSDARLKTKVADVSNGLEAIMKLEPIKFKWSRELENSRTVTGFTAQNVGEAIPDAIFNSWKDKELGEVKSYYQDYLIPYLVKAIQELKQEIDTLKN